MAMTRRTGSLLILCVMTAAVTGLTAGPAMARTTWTVTPGGAITATSATIMLTDTTTGTSEPCSSSTVKGSLRAGTGPGAGIGGLTSVAFTSCEIVLTGQPFTLTGSHLPWQLNAVSYHSATGVTTATITGIHVVLKTTTSPGCSADLDGTSATADNGKITVTYANKTGKLTVPKTGSHLAFYNSTCSGIHNGDHAAFSTTYTVSPKQTITGS